MTEARLSTLRMSTIFGPPADLDLTLPFLKSLGELETQDSGRNSAAAAIFGHSVMPERRPEDHPMEQHSRSLGRPLTGTFGGVEDQIAPQPTRAPPPPPKDGHAYQQQHALTRRASNPTLQASPYDHPLPFRSNSALGFRDGYDENLVSPLQQQERIVTQWASKNQNGVPVVRIANQSSVQKKQHKRKMMHRRTHSYIQRGLRSSKRDSAQVFAEFHSMPSWGMWPEQHTPASPPEEIVEGVAELPGDCVARAVELPIINQSPKEVILEATKRVVDEETTVSDRTTTRTTGESVTADILSDLPMSKGRRLPNNPGAWKQSSAPRPSASSLSSPKLSPPPTTQSPASSPQADVRERRGRPEQRPSLTSVDFQQTPTTPPRSRSPTKTPGNIMTADEMRRDANALGIRTDAPRSPPRVRSRSPFPHARETAVPPPRQSSLVENHQFAESPRAAPKPPPKPVQCTTCKNHPVLPAPPTPEPDGKVVRKKSFLTRKSKQETSTVAAPPVPAIDASVKRMMSVREQTISPPVGAQSSGVFASMFVASKFRGRSRSPARKEEGGAAAAGVVIGQPVLVTEGDENPLLISLREAAEKEAERRQREETERNDPVEHEEEILEAPVIVVQKRASLEAKSNVAVSRDYKQEDRLGFLPNLCVQPPTPTHDVPSLEPAWHSPPLRASHEDRRNIPEEDLRLGRQRQVGSSSSASTGFLPSSPNSPGNGTHPASRQPSPDRGRTPDPLRKPLTPRSTSADGPRRGVVNPFPVAPIGPLKKPVDEQEPEYDEFGYPLVKRSLTTRHSPSPRTPQRTLTTRYVSPTRQYDQSPRRYAAPEQSTSPHQRSPSPTYMDYYPMDSEATYHPASRASSITSSPVLRPASSADTDITSPSTYATSPTSCFSASFSASGSEAGSSYFYPTDETPYQSPAREPAPARLRTVVATAQGIARSKSLLQREILTPMGTMSSRSGPRKPRIQAEAEKSARPVQRTLSARVPAN